MQALGQYAMTVSAAAMLCGLVQILCKEWKGQKRFLDLVCGLIMLSIVLAPLKILPALTWEDPTEQFRASAADVIAQAKQNCQENLEAIISNEVSEYIVDKAAQVGISAKAEVCLSDSLQPISCRIIGVIPMSVRARLSEEISQELGIPKEAQSWEP